jgi:hypothetical protein
LLKRNAVEQSHDALRARSQIVKHLRRKLHRPEIANTSVAILSLEIALDDQLSVLEDEKTVKIPHAPLSDGLIKSSDDLVCELVRRQIGLLLRRGQPQRRCHGRSSNC